MALEKQALARGAGSTSSDSGMVLRAIRKDPESNERIISLLQEVGELLYGVDHINKLNGEQRSNWVKRSNEFAKAQGNFSSFLALLEEMFEEARKDDERLLEAELEDLEARFSLEAKLASRDQERKGEREAEKREQDRAVFDVELEEKKQSTEEKAALHTQTLKERETRRKLRRAQDVELICITAFSALLSGILIVYGVVHEELLFVGGSSLAATITLAGVAKLAVSWEGRSATKESEEPH
jgi:hypothetical protein